MLPLPVAVVTGATKRNVEMSCCSSSPSKRATSAPGNVVAAGAGGARRPCAALQNRLDAKSLCHHDAHRMIEEFMLLANEAVATRLMNLNL